jgi:hypothetical protein
MFVLLIFCSSCSPSSGPSHTDDDYRNAKIVTNSIDAYQDSYQFNNEADDDWIVSSDSELTFVDGSTETNSIELYFDGVVADSNSYCVFHVYDERDSAKLNTDEPKLVRHCDGKTPERFQLGDVSVWITGHQRAELLQSLFHIDRMSGPKMLSYYKGHSPSSSGSGDDDDH